VAAVAEVVFEGMVVAVEIGCRCILTTCASCLVATAEVVFEEVFEVVFEVVAKASSSGVGFTPTLLSATTASASGACGIDTEAAPAVDVIVTYNYGT
jgi:hypothetical protein